MSKDIWIVVLVTVIITLVGGYIVNWTSAPIAQKYRKWLDDRAQIKAKKSVKNAKRRIEKLESELQILSYYRQYPLALIARTYKVFSLMVACFAGLLLSGFAFFINYVANPFLDNWDVFQVLGALVIPFGLIVIWIMALNLSARMDKVAFPNAFESTTRKQITDLQEVIKKFENAGITSNPGI